MIFTKCANHANQVLEKSKKKTLAGLMVMYPNFISIFIHVIGSHVSTSAVGNKPLLF